MERKPPSHVPGVPAVLLKAERAVVPHENVNAMVAYEIVKGCYDSSGNGCRAKLSPALPSNLARVSRRRRGRISKV